MKIPEVCGISVLNPVDIEENYLNYTVDYAIDHKFNHFQFIGPIHNPVKGNVDGMTFYKKYARFNNEKDADYVKYNLKAVNVALEKLHANGVKSYMWHHELELPVDFTNAFPEVLNSDGDVEVSHPLVKDFLENKIKDFFDAYPLMDGLILTLHETRVPLLKLKNQKLSKVERVKHVTKILFDTCKSLGKQLICRPFASIEEDYAMMMKAYEEISTDMIIMDKWTQFDWSLCLPHNKFYNKITKNPLLVETDIFGEFFGKGRFPLMLKTHILDKYDYCTSFPTHLGFCSRIDRAGRHPFGDVNEVNLIIMNACTKGENVEKAIDDFFNAKYGECGSTVKEIMENTEEILRRTIYLKGFYYSELSLFPGVNHSKNHFYFEMMREDYKVNSGEWFIPIGWDRGSIQSVFDEKASAVQMAKSDFEKLLSLQDKMDKTEYDKLFIKFANLYHCTMVWEQLTFVYYYYAKYFELNDKSFEGKLYDALDKLLQLNQSAIELLGENFYCLQGDRILVDGSGNDFISDFVKQVKDSFEIEKDTYADLVSQNLKDFVICGGGSEHHGIKKEVNFSDTLINNGKLCRMPGSNRGRGWSSVNTHGWFSYDVKVKKDAPNVIAITVGSKDPMIDFTVSIDGQVYKISQENKGDQTFRFKYIANNNDYVTVRIDRISGNTPLVYNVKVL
ncbi:MAG: hypothetical protein II988_06085 [Clostridia bacterium]|nr:hypothetical protein [Clostridia bacterium]